MKINSKDFRVREGDEVNLKKWPTKVNPVYKSKEQYQNLLGEHVAELSSQQQLLYASNRHAVLLIFQAMDAAGKDGAIKALTEVDPAKLTPTELAECPELGALPEQTILNKREIVGEEIAPCWQQEFIKDICCERRITDK